MPTPESIALRNELGSPSVVSPAQVRQQIGTLGAGLNRVSQQMSVLQQLLRAAEATEDDPMVEQKFEGLAQRFRGLQKLHDKLDEDLHVLARTMRELQREVADFVAIVDGGGA